MIIIAANYKALPSLWSLLTYVVSLNLYLNLMGVGIIPIMKWQVEKTPQGKPIPKLMNWWRIKVESRGQEGVHLLVGKLDREKPALRGLWLCAKEPGTLEPKTLGGSEISSDSSLINTLCHGILHSAAPPVPCTLNLLSSSLSSWSGLVPFLSQPLIVLFGWVSVYLVCSHLTLLSEHSSHCTQCLWNLEAEILSVFWIEDFLKDTMSSQRCFQTWETLHYIVLTYCLRIHPA